MGIVITDGRGNGHQAGVSGDNALNITGSTRTTAEKAILAGDGLISGVAEQIIDVATEDIVYHYINSSSSGQIFQVSHMDFSWNGGNTSGNKLAVFRGYVVNTAPTANNITIPAGNPNVASAKVPPMTINVWNTVPGGITAATLRHNYTYWFPPGTYRLNFEGLFVLGVGNGQCISLECSEAGTYTLGITGWFSDLIER